MNGFEENIGAESSADLFKTIEILILDAAAATDAGNYVDALEGFRLALELMQRYFGDNAELDELRENITEVFDLLNERQTPDP